MAKKEEDRKVCHCLYLGMNVGKDDRKRYYMWYFLPDGFENNGDPLGKLDQDELCAYSKPWIPSAEPGLVVTIDRDMAKSATHTIYRDTVKIIGLWQCREDRARWQAENKVVSLAWAAEKQSKFREDLEQLEPLRKLYNSLRGQQRQALLLNVILRITGR